MVARLSLLSSKAVGSGSSALLAMQVRFTKGTETLPHQEIPVTMLVLVRALLSLPTSNAGSEHCFSMVRKIDSAFPTPRTYTYWHKK